MGQIVPVHRPSNLGTPFGVELLGAVRMRRGETTIPDFAGMVHAVSMERLRQDRRLAGDEMRFLRKAAGIARVEMGAAIGETGEAIESIEKGPRPMTAALEKYIRLHLYNRLRHKVGDRGVGMMFDYIDWIMDEWRARPQDASIDTTIRLGHDETTGWFVKTVAR